jgi:TolB-like protein/class 3 adenylate cyclase/Flp pilus assembly protein TadD
MFTDMVGYSALAQRNEALSVELLEEHRALLRPIFSRFNGTEIKTIGDAFLVEFQSALEAAQCAIEIQRALAKRNHDVTSERRIELKIGIHIGDVVHRGGDVYGDGVNIASRIEPLAGAGGICVSMDVERQIRNALEARFEKLGPTELKNISVPMELFRIVLPWESRGTIAAPLLRKKLPALIIIGGAVIVVAVLIWLLTPHPDLQSRLSRPVQPSPTNLSTGSASLPAPDQKSIAVLAFVNMSADKDNEYFSDGITEEILNTLARTPGLHVAARTSAFSFKSRNESVQRIGEALKVGAVLEGSVRRSGNQLRITAQLINVADGFHLWSETFDRKAEDIFAIQTEVAQRVQGALKVKLLAGAAPNASFIGTDNLEAYDLYLRGRQFWNLRTGDDVQRAVGLFQQAIEKDPKFAAAYAGLASSYSILSEYASLPMRETNPKAQAAARRALELDAGLAEAHAVLGVCAYSDWDLAGAEREYREALRLNPNYATTHHWYSLLLVDLGKREEAFAEILKAQELDPLSAVIQSIIGAQHFFAGRYEEALMAEDQALKLSPDFPSAHQDRGKILLMQKKFPEAIAEFEKVRSKVGDIPYALGWVGNAYARAGRTNDARHILETLKTMSASGRAASVEIALVFLGLGEMGQTFEWLERAAASRDWDPRSLKCEPLMADIIKDPRYAALLSKFGLEK